jgi:hypothetical protein
MPTTCKTVFVVHEIGGKAYGCCRENAFAVILFALGKSNKKQAILLLYSCWT